MARTYARKYPRAYAKYRSTRRKATTKRLPTPFTHAMSVSGRQQAAALPANSIFGGIPTKTSTKKFTAMLAGGLIVMPENTITEVVNSFSVNLNALPGSSHYIALFDEYKIDLWEVWFKSRQPGWPSVTGNSTTTTTIDRCNSHLIVARDTIGTSAQPSNVVLAYDNAVVVQPHEDYYIQIKPKALMNVGGTNSDAPRTSPWCSITDASVPHYGILNTITASGATSVAGCAWDIVQKVHVTFREGIN